MPTISMFYGVLIRLFFHDTDKHHVPHIHAEYQGEVAVYSIKDGCVLAGSIPPAKHKLVVAWIEIHQEDLRKSYPEMTAYFRLSPQMAARVSLISPHTPTQRLLSRLRSGKSFPVSGMADILSSGPAEPTFLPIPLKFGGKKIVLIKTVPNKAAYRTRIRAGSR
jgi:desulfoferrodoxin (superoxide reductase-like protein)